MFRNCHSTSQGKVVIANEPLLHPSLVPGPVRLTRPHCQSLTFRQLTYQGWPQPPTNQTGHTSQTEGRLWTTPASNHTPTYAPIHQYTYTSIHLYTSVLIDPWTYRIIDVQFAADQVGSLPHLRRPFIALWYLCSIHSSGYDHAGADSRFAVFGFMTTAQSQTLPQWIEGGGEARVPALFQPSTKSCEATLCWPRWDRWAPGLGRPQ